MLVRHAYGLYKVGMIEQAITQAEKLWAVGFSQPDECDPIFNVWREADGITPEIAWQRFVLSLKKNSKDLSSYLIRVVDRKDKPFATNYRLVHLKPKTIKQYKSFKAQNTRNREIILHGVKRLAGIDPQDALPTLGRYEKLQNFDPAELEDTYAYIGVQGKPWRTAGTRTICTWGTFTSSPRMVFFYLKFQQRRTKYRCKRSASLGMVQSFDPEHDRCRYLEPPR